MSSDRRSRRLPRPVRWPIAPALAAACAALAVACFAPDYPQGIPCSEARTCPPGQQCDPSDLVCRVVPRPDPCAGAPCGSGTCTREGDGYRCACDPGHAPVSQDGGETCADIDECVDAPCGAGGACRNLDGSYECVCLDGFAGPACADIDECAAAPCGVGGTCQNLDGSYECVCLNGFAGPACADIDECAGAPCGPGTCTNAPGSYTCACPPGFVPADPGGGETCVGVDECAISPDPCAPGGVCIDGDNGYACACSDGYVFDGQTCVPIRHTLVGAGSAGEPRRWSDGTVAASCQAYRAPGPPYFYEGATGDGIYSVQGPGMSGPASVLCDMTSDGGGWTLIASLVNDGIQRWNSLEAWTDASSFGELGSRQQVDFKSVAFAGVAGADLMVRTEEYAFAFHALLDRDFAGFVAGAFTPQCNRVHMRSGVDWSENLSAAQAAALSFLVRPHDSNASCFPGSAENAIIGIALASCCWAAGLGNTPMGGQWSTHDLSLLLLARLVPASCTPGVYPCNGNGAHIADGSFCYDASCKARYAELYVR